MNIELFRLLFDAGLFVLIWMVQLIVYPGFQYYASEQLLTWHNTYTPRITVIVMPLMLGQLALAALQLWTRQDWYTLSSALIIALLWGSTFLYFIPLHGQIANNQFNTQTLQELVSKNWGRTFLWTLLLALSLLRKVNG
ncbi:MAG: hypothetical protein AAGG75_10460 [Bacteroidota bacterium]